MSNKKPAVGTSSTTRTASTAVATIKLKILCLHGRCQSGSMMSNKIAGARKKLQRVYDLDFLDAPFEIKRDVANDEDQHQPPPPRQLEWWTRDESTGKPQSNVKEAFEYVIESTKDKDYDAVVGFSQGGLLGTAMVLMGAFPTVRAVVTAGSPFRQEPFETADQFILQLEQEESSNIKRQGKDIPKLHFAGETDTMVPVNSVQQLCETGGNGRVIIHEKGHLFPTKAVYVNEMLEFLKMTLDDDDDEHHK
jgi:predicted esterase